VLKVSATGSFSGSTLTGRATLNTLDPSGTKLSPDARFTFSGRRMAVQ
jgi:hypothetical protein